MQRKRLYIGISFLLIILIVGLIGWAIFIGRQQQELQQGTQDLGFLDNPGTRGSSSGGLFGGVFGDNISNTSTDESDEQELVTEPVLRQLYNLPISGYIKKRADAVRFVDRATGHIFEKDLPNGSTTRVDQTTVPHVYHAVFTDDGDGVIRRYVDTEDNTVSVYSVVGNTSASAVPLPTGVRDVVADPRGEHFAVLQETNSGSSVYITDGRETQGEPLFVSTLRDWDILWRENSLLLTQKPSSAVPGSSYSVNVTSGIRELALQQYPGLITNLSPAGDKILYSIARRNSRPELFVRTLATQEDTPLRVAGFADKCTWDPTGTLVYCGLPDTFPSAQYPDAWYRGEIRFSDSLWEIDVTSVSVRNILSPATQSGISLDIENITIDAQGGVVFFKNAADQTLWSVTLPQEIRPEETEEDTEEIDENDTIDEATNE